MSCYQLRRAVNVSCSLVCCLIGFIAVSQGAELPQKNGDVQEYQKSSSLLQWPPGAADLQPQEPQTGRKPFHQAMEEIYRLEFQAMEVTGGLSILSVTSGGPATGLRRVSDGALITLETGDVITRVNGQAIATFSDYYQAMERCRETGGRVELTARDTRTGNLVQLIGQASLQCVPASKPPHPDYAYRLRVRAEPASGGGLRLAWVDELGPMSRLAMPTQPNMQASAEPGDVIVSIDGVPVNSEQDYRRVMQQIAARCGQTRLEMRNVRNGEVEPWLVKAILTKREDLVAQPYPPILNQPILPPQAQPQPDSQPQPNPSGRRLIHLLLCGLTDDASIGPMVKISIERLERLIDDQIGSEFIGSRTILTGDQCTAESIVKAVRELSLSPDDSLFCFYVGHGAYASYFQMGDLSGGHFFQIPKKDLSRKRLFDELKLKGARLTVLISDTCNVRSPTTPEFGQLTPELKAERIRGLTEFESLLLEYRGVIDISASSRDEYSWFSIPIGGWFTEQFANAMLADPQNWRELYDNAYRRTNEFFKLRRRELLANSRAGLTPPVRKSLEGQNDLRPAAFQLSVQSDPYRSYDKSQEREMQKTHFSFHGNRRY